MRPIAVRQRVRLRDRSGDFLVISVDRERQVADLVPVHGPQVLEEDVPLSALSPIEASPDAPGRRPNGATS